MSHSTQSGFRAPPATTSNASELRFNCEGPQLFFALLAVGVGSSSPRLAILVSEFCFVPFNAFDDSEAVGVGNNFTIVAKPLPDVFDTPFRL